MERTKVDYLVIGAGLAGLSLALELSDLLERTGRTMLILDASIGGYPPRTWSFWEAGPGSYDDLLAAQWSSVYIAGGEESLRRDIRPYRYKTLSSDAFRTYAFDRLANCACISFREDTVRALSTIRSGTGRVLIQGSKGEYIADRVFDSRWSPADLQGFAGITLWQQFKGWFVETDSPVFDPGTVDMMDFRTEQDQGAVAFFYVLPFSDRRALVEYTLFTATAAEKSLLDQKLADYMRDKTGGDAYHIRDKEYGMIPMTGYRFTQRVPYVYPIGTAGGCSKPSSGYTFTFVQRQVQHIRLRLEQDRFRTSLMHIGRFHFYDRVLLRVIAREPARGSDVFVRLFRRNPPARVLRFLNNDTTLMDEIRIFATLPIGAFLRSAVTELFSPGSR